MSFLVTFGIMEDDWKSYVIKIKFSHIWNNTRLSQRLRNKQSTCYNLENIHFQVNAVWLVNALIFFKINYEIQYTQVVYKCVYVSHDYMLYIFE